jgi:hypothetical protein
VVIWQAAASSDMAAADANMVLLEQDPSACYDHHFGNVTTKTINANDI